LAGTAGAGKKVTGRSKPQNVVKKSGKGKNVHKGKLTKARTPRGIIKKTFPWKPCLERPKPRKGRKSKNPESPHKKAFFREGGRAGGLLKSSELAFEGLNDPDK